MLTFDNVSKIYHGKAGELKALSGFDLSIAKGSSVAFIGPSGCGKSTALLLASGLLKPSSGQIKVAGETIIKPRLQTALILQDFGLLPWKTVFENATLGLQVRKVPKAQRMTRTNKELEQVGLGAFAKSYPSELSGGMRQRLAIARALALDVDLILMDEPLSALDLQLRESLQELLLELWKQRGYTQILVTHSIEEAVFLGQQIVVISPRPGRIATQIDNNNVGIKDWRTKTEFFEKCNQVRQALAESSALSADPSSAISPAPSSALSADLSSAISSVPKTNNGDLDA